MKSRWKTCAGDESGGMAVTVAVCLTMLLAATGLALDFSRMAWVKNELQTAADAGALAGANGLSPYIGAPPEPNWNGGQTAATQTVLLNRADGQALTHCNVTYGYWSLTARTLPLQSTAIVPTVNDVPAVQVDVTKGDGLNRGPLPMLFMGNARSLSAQAVAIYAGIGGMAPGGVGVPLAADKNIVEQYWYQSPPVTFRIGKDYDNGQWTSFLVDNNSASYTRGLIENGNPTALNVGDSIYIQPGAKATLYGDLGDLHNHKTVVIPLVDPPLDYKTTREIKGFVAFYIENFSQGGKYVEGHFDKDYVSPDAVPGGAYYGAAPSPRLVK